MASEAGDTVPHFADEYNYRIILEPGWKPKAKKMKGITWSAPDETDEYEVAPPAPKKPKLLALPL